TNDVAQEARRKLREKRLDLIVANDVTAPGAGFGSDTNVVQLIDAAGETQGLPVLPKDEVAGRILDWAVARRERRPALRRARGSTPPGPSGRGGSERVQLRGHGRGHLTAMLEGPQLPAQRRGTRQGGAPGGIGRLAGAAPAVQQQVLDGGGAERVE